jgi:hypothetical protein
MVLRQIKCALLYVILILPVDGNANSSPSVVSCRHFHEIMFI